MRNNRRGMILGYFLLSITCTLNVQAQNLIPEQELKRWGYKSVKLRYPLHYCDTDIDHRIQRDAQSIRSLKPLADEPHTYYRYSLIKESYDSKRNASNRLASFRKPSKVSIKYSKTCNIRLGFQQGLDVYIIHTDVAMFSYAERDRLISLLKKRVSEGR